MAFRPETPTLMPLCPDSLSSPWSSCGFIPLSRIRPSPSPVTGAGMPFTRIGLKRQWNGWLVSNALKEPGNGHESRFVRGSAFNREVDNKPLR